MRTNYPVSDRGATHESDIHALTDLESRGTRVELDGRAWSGAESSRVPEVSERFAEELRVIKRRLLRAIAAERKARGNIIMVASAGPGDGKSFIALNLAASIAADHDHDVVLIDGDFRKPHISRGFGLEDQPGFLDLVYGTAQLPDVIHPTGRTGLTVIAAGRNRADVNEALASRRAQALIDRSLANVAGKIVIFDSSPLLYASEAQVLARMVGKVVIVVRAGITPERSLTQAIQAIDGVGDCSVILNDADVVPLSGYYSRTYGYGLGK